MLRSLVQAAVAAAVVTSACSPDVITAGRFRISASVTTKLAADSQTCTITWKSVVNDPARPYLLEIAFAGDTGVLPDTGTTIVSDSLLTTGPASVEGDFRNPDLQVGWRFFWDTLSTSDSVRVRACAVQ